MICKHCGQPIIEGWQGTVYWFHDLGEGSVMRRCDTRISGKPYGLEAEPAE